MAKRIFTEDDLREIERRINNIPYTEAKIIFIDTLQRFLPKASSGDYLGSIKWWLSSKKRRLRIKLSNVLGTHTLNDELRLINEVGGKCSFCGDCSNPTIDHIIPIIKGGSNGIENLQVLCGSCNSKKGGKYAE